MHCKSHQERNPERENHRWDRRQLGQGCGNAFPFTYVFCVVELLEHVLSDHCGREVDDEEEDVDGGGLRLPVLGGERDLERGQDAEVVQRLEEALPRLRLQRLRERAELLEEEHRLAPRLLVRLVVGQLREELREELLVLLRSGEGRSDSALLLICNYSFFTDGPTHTVRTVHVVCEYKIDDFCTGARCS